MSRGPRLVLLGKQGAGKGTQAARLAEHFTVEHLSTGELFRAAKKQGTPFGLEAAAFMDRGELVPDDIVVGVVAERIGAGRFDVELGFVLDGFPRTLAQAEDLDRILGTHTVDVAIDLDVPTDIVIDRIAGRRVCDNCGTNYHITMPPKVDWICDVCGGEVVQRADDTETAVLRRLELYERETRPILSYYGQRDLLAVVDGQGDSDVVFERLVCAVEARSLIDPA